MVLQGADDDFIARLEVLLQAVSQQVEGLGGAAGEDQLLRIRGIQPARGLFSRGFESAGGAFTRQVLGAMHVGGAAGVIAKQGIEHGLGFLCGGGAVEVGLALGLKGQDAREVSAPGGDQWHGVFSVYLAAKSWV